MRRCLDSLLEQDISQDEYELVCINDGSPDDSMQIAEQYADKYKCVRVLSQTNRGPSAARNTGIRAAKGKYIYFVDPDDYVQPNSLRVLLEKMENENLDMLRFGYQMVDEQYRPCMPYKHYVKPDLSAGVMTGRDYLCNRLGYSCFIWTYVFRTAIIKDNNLYCSEGVYFDDTDWLPKVLLKTNRIDCIDVVRHFYLIRSGSLVNTKDEKKIRMKMEGSLQIIKILSEDKEKNKDEEVRSWYQQMITVHALSFLTALSVDFFEERSLWIKRLKEYDAFSVEFPLSRYGVGTNKKKLLLMRISPDLFCRIVHWKNSR